MVRQRSEFMYRFVVGRYTGFRIIGKGGYLPAFGVWIDAFIPRLQRLGLYLLLLNRWTSYYRLGLTPNSSYQFSALNVPHPPAMGAAHCLHSNDCIVKRWRVVIVSCMGEGSAHVWIYCVFRKAANSLYTLLRARLIPPTGA